MSQEVKDACINLMMEKFHAYKPFELCGESVYVMEVNTDLMFGSQQTHTFHLSNGSVLKLSQRSNN